MKKVYTSDNIILAGHIHSLLEAYDINCHMRNMNLSGGIGELPINECWPEVWVNDHEDYAVAEELIAASLSKIENKQSWQCTCGEQIEGQFDACWSCGKPQVTT